MDLKTFQEFLSRLETHLQAALILVAPEGDETERTVAWAKNEALYEVASAIREAICDMGWEISPENFIPELSATGAADLAALMAAPPRRIPALAAALARSRPRSESLKTK